MTTINAADADPRTPPDEQWVQDVCKIGQGAACCRYLGRTSAAGGGWTCLKFAPDERVYIDSRVANGTMGSRGDNCPGRAQLL